MIMDWGNTAMKYLTEPPDEISIRMWIRTYHSNLCVLDKMIIL